MTPWCPGCGYTRTCDVCRDTRVADRVLCLCTPTEPTDAHAPGCEAARARADGLDVLPPRLHRAVEQKMWERDGERWVLAGTWVQLIPVEHLAPCEVVILDTETTGLSDADRVCEVGMARVDLATGRIIEEREQLCDPGVPSGARAINGIADRDLRGQPRLVAIWPAVRAWIGTRPVLAHNAAFDRKMLARECPDADTLAWHCTKAWARAALPGVASHKLQDLATHLKLPRGTAHRALGDVRTLAALATRLYGVTRALPGALARHPDLCFVEISGGVYAVLIVRADGREETMRRDTGLGATPNRVAERAVLDIAALPSDRPRVAVVRQTAVHAWCRDEHAIELGAARVTVRAPRPNESVPCARAKALAASDPSTLFAPTGSTP